MRIPALLFRALAYVCTYEAPALSTIARCHCSHIDRVSGCSFLSHAVAACSLLRERRKEGRSEKRAFPTPTAKKKVEPWKKRDFGFFVFFFSVP